MPFNSTCPDCLVGIYDAAKKRGEEFDLDELAGAATWGSGS